VLAHEHTLGVVAEPAQEGKVRQLLAVVIYMCTPVRIVNNTTLQIHARHGHSGYEGVALLMCHVDDGEPVALVRRTAHGEAMRGGSGISFSAGKNEYALMSRPSVTVISNLEDDAAVLVPVTDIA
jgi:hypothetical protein